MRILIPMLLTKIKGKPMSSSRMNIRIDYYIHAINIAVRINEQLLRTSIWMSRKT